MTPIRTTKRRAQTEASLGKIQPVPHRPSHPVIRHPAYIFLADASLQHQVFDQPSNRIVRQSRYNRRVHPKGAPQAPGNVVFTSALPCTKMTGGRNAFIPRIEPQHDFTKTNEIPQAAILRFDTQLRHNLNFTNSPVPQVTAWSDPACAWNPESASRRRPSQKLLVVASDPPPANSPPRPRTVQPPPEMKLSSRIGQRSTERE